MPSYRGVSQSELVGHIDAGLALLEKHSPGPVTQAFIDDLHATTKLSDIASAKDDAALHEAIFRSDVVGLFSSARKVFEYHEARNTDGGGSEVYQGILKAGLDGGPYTLLGDTTPLDAECDKYLKLRRVTGAFRRAVARARGKTQPENPYRKQDYSVVAADLNEARALVVPVTAVLDPYLASGDLEEILGAGYIDNDRSAGTRRAGVLFASTRRAAEAVARAFPAHQVLDIKGRPVTIPPAKPGTPKL